MSEASVSFVIPHKGRELFLQQTLASIAAQEYSVPIKVIVVTQNASLASETLCYGSEVSLEFIYADTDQTISGLRNQGVRASDSTHLAFLDADIALSPNWLEALLPILDGQGDVALVSAMQLPGADPPALEQIRTTLSNANLDTAVDFLPGRNLLLLRTTFEDVGGFPEHLRTCEDYYFTDKVSKFGKLWYSSLASYVHLGEDKELDEMFRKEIWRGQSNLQSLRGRHIGLSEWPSFLVPPWITLITGLALVLLLSDKPLLALLVFLGALLPFGAYVTRLYFLAKRRIHLGHIVAFYSYYFPARTWGTLLGAFRSFGNNLHDQ